MVLLLECEAVKTTEVRTGETAPPAVTRLPLSPLNVTFLSALARNDEGIRAQISPSFILLLLPHHIHHRARSHLFVVCAGVRPKPSITSGRARECRRSNNAGGGGGCKRECRCEWGGGGGESGARS
eukprot:2544498-Rhodomonas_salina.1